MKTLLKYPENKKNLTKFLAFVVCLAAIAVIIGWLSDIPILKSISPRWVSMKFDTAVCFFLSGIGLYSIARAIEGELDKSQVVLSLISLIIILLMGVLFFSALLKVYTGAEDIFIKEAPGGVKTVTPGRPSLPTIINFILVAIAGIFTMLGDKKIQPKLKVIGMTVGAVGALAVVGYTVNLPTFYYYIKGVNSAMACHTAILFVLLGVGLACL